jgi:hypothetical protein
MNFMRESLGSVDLKAKEQTFDMNGGDEGSGELCAARSDSPPALEGTEDVFNDVPCPIQFMIVRSLLFPAFNRRDDCCYIRFLKHVERFVRVIRFVRKERFRFQTIHKERRLATVRDSAAFRYPALVNCQMQFAVQPLFCTADYPNCRRAPRMRFDIRRIYHTDIPGRLAYCGIRRRFPYSLVPPAAKPLMYAVPVSEFGRHVSPRSARVRLPRYRVDKQAVVFRHAHAFPCLSGQQVFYPFPRLVAYIVPVNAFISFHAPILPLFPIQFFAPDTVALFESVAAFPTGNE